MPHKRTPRNQAEQSRRFVETARDVGCDEIEAAFDEKLAAIAGKKPESKKKAPDD